MVVAKMKGTCETERYDLLIRWLSICTVELFGTLADAEAYKYPLILTLILE